MTGADSDRAWNLIEKAGDRMDVQDYKGAIKFYNKALNIEPANICALEEKALAHSFLKQLDKSIECHEKIFECEPDSLKTMQLLAALYAETERDGDALKLYDRMLEIEPDNLDTMTEKAVAHHALGRKVWH